MEVVPVMRTTLECIHFEKLVGKGRNPRQKLDAQTSSEAENW
jgi:hypothetical protein